MAKLSAHGGEIGRVEYAKFVKAYRVDGTILRNTGFGWKEYGKVKAGVTPQIALQHAREAQQARYALNPAYARFVKALIGAAGITKRWQLYTAIELMPDDPDGVWSTMDDEGMSLGVDEVVELCRLYKAALDEAGEKNAKGEE